MPNVQIPGVGVVPFPDEMPPNEIHAAVRRRYQAAIVGPPRPSGPYSGTPDEPTPASSQGGMGLTGQMLDPTQWAAALMGGPAAREAGYGAEALGQIGPRIGAALSRVRTPASNSVADDLLQYATHQIPGSAEARLGARLLSRFFGGRAAQTTEAVAPQVTGTAVWGGPAAFGEATQAAAPAAEAAEEAVPEGFTRVTTHVRRLPKGAQARTVAPAPAPPAPSVGKIVPGPGAPVMPMPARAALGNAGGNLEDLLSQSLRYGQAMQQAGINNPADQALLWQALRGQQ